MTEAWFSPQVAPFFSMFALLAVFAGFLRYAEKGIHRKLVFGAWYTAFGLAALLFAGAAAALVVDQPRYVAATLALTGVLVGAAFAWHLRDLVRLYREAELRGTIASDL